MTEHASTGDAINHAIDKASDGLAQIAHALSSAAPQAWELACKGVFAQGAATLVVGGVLLLPAVIFFVLTWWAARLANKDDDYAPFAIIAGIACVVFLVASIVNLATGDAWARVISPDGYLAQQVLSKALD